MMHTPLTVSPWTPAAAAGSGPAHTWIRSWPDWACLRADVTAAGWQWHSVDHIDRDAELLAAVFDLFAQRKRRQVRRNTVGQPHVLLAIGPEVPWHLRELILIAVWGRAVDIHLAVSAAHRDIAGHHPWYPLRFSDEIGGWYHGHSPAAGK